MYTNGQPEMHPGAQLLPGPTDGEPDMVPVPPSGCGGCLQDNGTKMLTWKFVGEGQGNFQPRQSYDYVGSGRGSYEKEVVVTPGKWNMWKVVMCVSVPLVLLLIGLVTASILGVQVGLRGGGSASRANEGLTPVNFDCTDGLDTWAGSWSTQKQDWCCANYGRGCMPKMKGCNTECNFMQKTYSCAYRIQWGATHKYLNQPAACQQAYSMVARQCPWCGSQCQLAQTNCQAAR